MRIGANKTSIRRNALWHKAMREKTALVPAGLGANVSP
jgi:hypothetical protein